MTSSFTRDDEGRLTVGGLPLEDIAATHGTPLYVYSGDGIRADYRNFAAAVAPVDGEVHFALKANALKKRRTPSAPRGSS